MTIWVSGGFRIIGIDSSIRIRFFFIIRKVIFWLQKTAFVINEIFVKRENDAKEKASENQAS